MEKLDRDRIAPEFVAAMRRVPPIPFGSRTALRLINWLAGRRKAQDWLGVAIESVVHGDVRARVYRPEQRASDAALLWIHGGGYVIGNALQDDRLCAAVARAAGIVVVSADYRLAPFDPFPAPLDDCHAVWRWMRASADSLGIDPDRIVIGGMSAGGGLAATLVQRVHDEGAAPLGQWLLSPMLDDRTAADRTLDALDNPIWNNAKNRIGWKAYLGIEPGARTLPAYAAASRRDDLRGLPPAWIGIGELDLFHDEEQAYAARLREARVATEVDIVPGAPHGFEAWGFDTPIAQAYEARAIGWLRRVIGVA